LLISIIVAMTKNRVIGCNGQLPCQCPEDLRRFKRLTMGQPLVMGRRTFESIGHPLPGRRTIVVSRNPDYAAVGCDVTTSLNEAFSLIKNVREIFVCGGEEIYRQALPLTDRIYLTELNCRVPGDTWFPEFSHDEFTEIYSELHANDEVPHRFSILQRHDCHEPLNLES